ncbi:hypothetical protein NMG60_11024074 [Bertholletia excelsa]
MAEFTADMQCYNYKPPFSYLDIDPNMELVNQFPEANPTCMEINPNFQSSEAFSMDNLFMQQQPPEFPGNLADIFTGIFHQDSKNVLPIAEPIVPPADKFQKCKKRKAIDVPECSSGISSAQPVSEGMLKEKLSGKGKKAKRNCMEEETPKEVVHVRARRGQATDSHSLAERVRRGKINERLKCLQGIVPGCYKTMGMAVMLDEIINYVQSLQNQVEFLSMKLSAASRFYDFNSESDAMEAMQAIALNSKNLSKQCQGQAYQAQKVQRLVTERDQTLASTQLGFFDLNFGSYPSFPCNK